MIFDIKLVIVVLVVAVVLIVVLGGGKNRTRAGFGRDARRCPGCGTDHPPFAQFCRRCGRKLS